MLPLTVASRTEKTADGRVKESPVASPVIPIFAVLLLFAAMIAFAVWATKKQVDMTREAIKTGNVGIVAAVEAPMLLGGLANLFNRPR